MDTLMTFLASGLVVFNLWILITEPVLFSHPRRNTPPRRTLRHGGQASH